MATLQVLRQAQQNAQTFVLKDGRKVFFNEFGAADGYPIIHFHGHGSCRLEGALFDSVARQNGFRVISHSRPGTEKSTIDTNFSFASHASDTYQLAQYLNIERFGVTGWSGGGPFVMSTCHYLGHQYDCISFGGLMGSFAPLSVKTYKAMALRDRFFTKLSREYPDLMYRSAINLLWYFVMKQPKMFWKYMQQSIGKEDRKLFETVDDGPQIFTELIQQTMANGVSGLCEEIKFQLDEEWAFDISDIKEDIKMFIFHGQTDQFVPIEIAKDIESKLNIHEAMYFVEGHMFPISSKYQEIMYQKFRDAVLSV
eukprot:238951_1